jgi:hypothetical protein
MIFSFSDAELSSDDELRDLSRFEADDACPSRIVLDGVGPETSPRLLCIDVPAEKIIRFKRKMVKPSDIQRPTWALWFDSRTDVSDEFKSGHFGERLAMICDMSMVDTSNQYNIYMKLPATLPRGSTLYVFRDDFRPMWETFPDGGCWTVKFGKDDDRLKSSWDKLVQGCLRDGLGSGNVAGIVLGSRPRDFSISVWLMSAKTSSGRFEVLENLKHALHLREGDILQYKDFDESIRDDSSKLHAVTYRVKNPDHNSKLLTPSKQRKYILPDPVTGSFTFKY